MGRWRFVIWIWSRVYRKWLRQRDGEGYDRVVLVKGWRTALVDTRGGSRMTISPRFWWFK